MSTSPVSPILPDTNPAVSQPAANPTAALGANEGTFLKLLVAQLEYQNPLNPTDGIQFVTQLAQFTTLEQETETNSQLSAIHSLLQQAASAQAAPPAATSNSGATNATSSASSQNEAPDATKGITGMDAANSSQ